MTAWNAARRATRGWPLFAPNRAMGEPGGGVVARSSVVRHVLVALLWSSSALAAPPEAQIEDGPARSPSDLRSSIESSMSELGLLTGQAKREKDMVLAACVLDKQERADVVMEIATGELLVLGDANSSNQTRTFAREKLDAAAHRLTRLVAEAKACRGDADPEAKDDVTRTQLDATQTIPLADPTKAQATSPIPPAIDPLRPPIASPVS